MDILNRETMWQRQQKKAEIEETELTPLLRRDVSLNRPALEEPKSDLRLVLLGGDCAYNCYASNIILRTVHTEFAISPKKGNIREGTVDGRQVSVFVAPSYWMEHLASYLFFRNRVESIRHEIQNCTSLTFPGPHAFLLVMRPGHATGKEHYLLKAITYMFGAEALQYTMVLFVHGHEWENRVEHLKNCCVKMCGARHFILENSNENIKELFKQINAMTRMKRNSFFVQKSYETVMKMCFEPWERAQVSKEAKLQKELEETKTKQSLRKDMVSAEFDSPRIERDLRKKLEASRSYESLLQKDLDKAMCNKIQITDELKASRHHESVLQKELDIAMRNERELRNELKASKDHESVLQKKLDRAKQSEIQLRKEMEHVLKVSKAEVRRSSINVLPPTMTEDQSNVTR